MCCVASECVQGITEPFDNQACLTLTALLEPLNGYDI
jgi:hypothetical protein